MALKYCCVLFVSLLFLCTVASATLPPKDFNVVKYGAVADGKTDNNKAFVGAWKDACEYGGKSSVLIPNGTFLLTSITFSGGCKGPIAFVVKGTIKAPTSNFFTDTWIGFRYLANLTVTGGGTFDGQGRVAWPYNNCKRNPQCPSLPVTMRLDFVNNSKLYNIRSIDSKSVHFSIFASENLNITNIRIKAPGNSPNTDGIRIGSSRKISISHSKIATGDDCISMLFGSQNIEMSDITCGPGHGISIGSLGRGHEEEYVSGISVRNSRFVNTDNGVRIKTFASSKYSEASNIVFQDIVMNNSANPIIIDQHYGPSPHFYSRVQSGGDSVQIKNVTFENIRGSSRSKVAVNLQCSGAEPCRDVKLINVDLSYNGRGRGGDKKGEQAVSQCANVFGSTSGKVVPGGCIR